jgi:hypothetical protein
MRGRKWKRTSIKEMAEIVNRHRNTVSADVREGRLDLTDLKSVTRYIVQKARADAQSYAELMRIDS